MFSLPPTSWILVITAALIVGFSKTGIGGLGIVAVPIMASIFPAKESTGILLPVLIFADLFAILFYRRYADWRILLRLIPFVIPGVITGFFFMKHISSQQLKPIIGIIVFLMLYGKFMLKHQKTVVVRNNIFITGITGILAGFITMTANAAGTIMAVYLLSMNLDKKEFVGTRAWYFFLINSFKVPFSVSLGLLTWHSLSFNFLLFPAILTGALLGYFLIKIIPQKGFEWAVILTAAAAATKLIFL